MAFSSNFGEDFLRLSSRARLHSNVSEQIKLILISHSIWTCSDYLFMLSRLFKPGESKEKTKKKFHWLLVSFQRVKYTVCAHATIEKWTLGDCQNEWLSIFNLCSPNNHHLGPRDQWPISTVTLPQRKNQMIIFENGKLLRRNPNIHRTSWMDWERMGWAKNTWRSYWFLRWKVGTIMGIIICAPAIERKRKRSRKMCSFILPDN